MTTKENREHSRRPVDIPVEFIVRGRLYWIKIGNINEGGVFVETEMSFSIGQNISMTYRPSSFGEENRIGKIVWIGPQGIGVKFEKL
jgi:Tfp pilus assembly protein PilZ